MDDYKIIVEQEHSTVMAHYEVTVYSGDWYLSYNLQRGLAPVL